MSLYSIYNNNICYADSYSKKRAYLIVISKNHQLIKDYKDKVRISKVMYNYLYKSTISDDVLDLLHNYIISLLKKHNINKEKVYNISCNYLIDLNL